MTPSARIAWRAAQTLVWLVGAAIVIALLFFPDVGIHAFWNVLIPIAPALVTFAPGLWRNICPMASTALFSRHMGGRRRFHLPAEWQGRLLLIAVVLLFLIVPLRHVVLDLNGPATATVILSLAALATGMGSLFEWKSGWCSGLCPVHPVEKLYGSVPAFRVPNAHCTACHRCVSPCPDSTPQIDPMTTKNGPANTWAGLLMVGAFPGFIWGWFQVPDYAGDEGWSHLGRAYGWPLLGALATLVTFVALDKKPRRVFAAAAIACYYWYRLPALFGFGPHPGDGMLVDMRGVFPTWFPAVSRVATTALFFWWLAGRTSVKRTWLRRPPFAEELEAT